MPSVYVSGSSSVEESEKCPICLVTFAEQEVGRPNTCGDIFCVDCLREWSRHMNTCPIDRRLFDVIFVINYPNRSVIKEIHVSPRPLQMQYAEIFMQYMQFCELCLQSDHEERMSSCHTCGLVYHEECLINFLQGVNAVNWLCPICNPIS
jgi:PHD and RING finger domain-containing protein 1